MTLSQSAENDRPWWRSGTVYQVYIRSFADANDDGTGDVDGLRSRLPYLEELGVDSIWITPWYPSPLRDGGYDVADYRNIDPRFGTIDEAAQLIADAHERNMRIITDIVPNHTSSDHLWFQKALASPRGSAARDRYIFRPGRGAGDEPPNDWQSVFGGSAWERVEDGDWYLHLFDVSQPDLNWRNADVRADFHDMLRFWLDLGVDGFRIDVAHGMEKDWALPDIGGREEILQPVLMASSSDPVDHPHWDRDGVHEITRGFRSILDEYEDRMMVAEAWVHPKRLPLYLRADEYHQSFNFALLDAAWDTQALKDVIVTSHTAATDVGATSTWVLSNHDVMRHATRYGLPDDIDWRTWPMTGPHDALDVDLGLRRARAAALLMLALPGVAYIYQGEELGLPEIWDLPEDVLDDPTWVRSGYTVRGRDGCRVPLPWETSGPSFGFGSTEPWLPQPDSFGSLSAAAQADDPNSMLSLYRQALSLRRQWLVDDEKLDRLELGTEVVAFRRGSGIACVLNLGPAALHLPTSEVLLASTALEQGKLPTDSCAWVRMD